MIIEWDEDKNAVLKDQRGVCFEDVLIAIEDNRILDILEHHNPARYPNQRLLIVELNDYIHYVPVVFEKQRLVLKNIIPSRRYHKIYKETS